MQSSATSEELQACWASLRGEEWTLPGIYERRLAADTVHALYAVLFRPSGQVGLALDLPAIIGGSIEEDAARGVVLRKEWRRQSGRVRLIVLLSEERFAVVFAVLASDIFDHVRAASSVESGAAALRA